MKMKSNIGVCVNVENFCAIGVSTETSNKILRRRISFVAKNGLCFYLF